MLWAVGQSKREAYCNIIVYVQIIMSRFYGWVETAEIINSTRGILNAIVGRYAQFGDF